MLLKFVILISCAIEAKSLSASAHIGWASNINESVVTTGEIDTLGVMRGKIVDSLTSTSIPYATVTFFKDDSSSMTIVASDKGEFSTDVKHLKSKIQISAIGYQQQAYYLVIDHNNLLRLKPVSVTLPNVIVSSKSQKKANASRIIKNVNKHFEQNYGDLTFDQRFNVEWILRNYDSTKCKRTAVIGFRFLKDQRVMLAKKWNEDTVNCDAVFFKFIGVERITSGDIGSRGDILRKEMVLSEKRRKSFDFRLLAHYEDKLLGGVYLISFKPLGTTIHDFYLNKAYLPLGYLRGEMMVRENDYAVISINYTWEMNVEAFNRQIEVDFNSPHWKAFKVNKIIANPVIYNYRYSYMKDTVTGKYFLQTIKADSYESGYQIETHRKVQLYYQYEANSLGVEKIVE